MSSTSTIQHKENETYQLVPGQDGDQHWLVRFLEGPFSETVLQYGAISFNEEQEGTMSFNFQIESSPDPDLTTESVELQDWAGEVLQEIIRDAIESGAIMMKERE